ncbi:MAG: glycoside hydrolase 100 family protein [Cyanobacteria bacterium J06581_3]
MNKSVCAAIKLLRKCSTQNGFIAATEKLENYENIWSRDGCVAGLASLIAKDEQLIQTFRANLLTLVRYQGSNGEIPSNVNVEKAKVSYGTTVGRVDASIWFLIGVCAFSRITGQDQLTTELWLNLERAHKILNAWEFNQGGLVYVPFGGDWADEYILSGYLLYDQALRLWAMREMSAAAKRIGKAHAEYSDKAQNIEALLSSRYVPTSERPYYLAGYNPAETFYQFDALGNALCCLLKLGSTEEHQRVLDFAQKISRFDLVPAFYPAIEIDDEQYGKLINAAKAAGKAAPRNKPGHYHNGGLWPFVNGFWALAARQMNRLDVCKRWQKGIDDANSLQDGGFYEFRDARIGKAQGMKGQAWSAAGTIFAHSKCGLDLVL